MGRTEDRDYDICVECDREDLSTLVTYYAPSAYSPRGYFCTRIDGMYIEIETSEVERI